MSSEVTSETKLGISQPYPFQCHEIDQSIAVAKKVKAYAVSGQLKTELEDTIDVLGDIEWETLDIIDSYEELRGALTAVREWGNEWKYLAKKLIKKYEPELLD